MNTRIRQLRFALKLTQKEFGAKIGLKPSSINDIEHYRCNVTERVIISICAKFSVSENWLRYGKGEMFISKDKKFKEFYEIFSHLNQPLQDFLIKVANDLLETQNLL